MILVKTFRVFIFLAVAMAVSASTCHAQEERTDSENQANEKTLFSVYQLEHVDPDLAMDIVSTVMSGQLDRIASDQRRKSLFVRAGESGHKALAALLKTIDRPQPNSDQIKMINGGELDASEVRANVSVLQSMLPQIEIAVSNSNLVLKGAPQDLEVAETLMTRLADSSKTSIDARALIVEVRWLRESGNAKTDMIGGELAKKLEARGFTSLSTVALLETRVSPNGQFACESSQTGSTLKIEGYLRAVDDGLEVQLETAASQPPTVDLEFQSSYFTKTDQWLVFGVAKGSKSAESGTGRDLILVRMKSDLPL